jgi:cephalosporin-C deacetylase-like acetyl esterase
MSIIKLFFAPFIFLAAFSLVHNNTTPAKQKNDGFNAHQIVVDEPLLVKGLEVKDFDKRRSIRLKDDVTHGLAETYLFESSAKYDITLFYVDEKEGRGEVDIYINDKPAGSIKFNDENQKDSSSFTFKKQTLSAINIQQWSKISLRFNGDKTEKCCIEKLMLTPVGAFTGNIEKLKKPQTLQVFENAGDQQTGRELLSRFVNDRIDSLMNERVAALRQLKTPEEWESQQNKTRAELENFFGKFPERTPLNTKITGKIEHEKYTIEKLYFESQPGYYVTANLYVPKNRKLPAPGVLLTSGHSMPGKAFLLYHEACVELALKGYVALAIDPMGQGERIEYFANNSKIATIEGAVNQHYYLGRPCFLVNWTFSGLRTWDCIRALDYLVSRPEVDTSKIAAVGNSGGGQMALLITAVDKRIKVCAAGHPGGQMEKNYLSGQNLFDRQILGLIAPRPVRIIQGEHSDGIPLQRKKIEDIQLFMEGLGYSKDRAQITFVDGVHDLKLPKRVAVYEWLNKWFDKEEEGSTPVPVQPEAENDLWATKSGLTLVSLGGETGQTLNAQRLKKVYHPAKDASELKRRIAERIRLNVNEKRSNINAHLIETIHYGDISVEKLTYQSEEGMLIPALLIKPKKINPSAPVYIYASEQGKPRSYNDTLTPFALAQKGNIVLAIDVRGMGETSPTASLPTPVKFSNCTSFQWIHDCLAIQSPGFGRTMLGMRTYDVIRGIDCIESQPGLKEKKIRLYGEGIGGLWATLAAIFDPRVDGVITENTLTSYKELVNNKYYAVSSAYFWGAAGVLCDFDIPDLVQLASAKPQVWLNPINETSEPLSASEATGILGRYKNIKVVIERQNEATKVLRSFQP